MTWGFPRVSTEMAIRNEAPQRLGLLADLTNPMWKRVVVDPKYRCLIPLTHFANPNGDPGANPRRSELRADVRNFTNVEPILRIGIAA